MSFHPPIHRKVKTSFEKSSVCQFPSFESLSSYWTSHILVPSIPVQQPGTDIVIGMYYDPVNFVTKHMERWLERRELEGSPLPPGYYRVRFKVYSLISLGFQFMLHLITCSCHRINIVMVMINSFLLQKLEDLA